MIHPRYRQMPERVRTAVNSMSLPEIRGSPIQAKPASRMMASAACCCSGVRF